MQLLVIHTYIALAEKTQMIDMKKVILLLLSIALMSCIKEDPSGHDLKIGDDIPDFTISMSDGSVVSGADLRKGISVIVFFTTACPDCQETLPHVQRLYDEYFNKGVSFTLISREESYDSIVNYWESEGLTMPFSAQEDRAVYELFARTRVPRVYINKDGIIRAIFTDQPESPGYEDLNEALLRL